jgi:hypothetical protein
MSQAIERHAGGERRRTVGHRPKHAAQTDYNWRRVSDTIRRRGRRSELVDEISAAAIELFDRVDELYYSSGWPYEYIEQKAYEAVQRARGLVSGNSDLTEKDLLAALMPVTYEWWPELSPLVTDARNAVERIRIAAAVAAYEPGPAGYEPGPEESGSNAAWRDVA